MNERIELYREILQQDPGSRAFFFLAGLLHETGRKEEAASVLRGGLRWYPDFLEARLLLIQVLLGGGDKDALRSETALVSGLLERYPGFWDAWARNASKDRPELALLLRLLAGALRRPGMGLEALLELGLAGLERGGESVKAACEPLKTFSPVRVSPEDSGQRGKESHLVLGAMTLDVNGVPAHEDAGDVVDLGDAPSFRTRSMANVLAEQGDFVGALEIYRELESRTADEEEVQALRSCIQLLEKRMGSCTPPDAAAVAGDASGEEASDAVLPDSIELNELLESLADRLEARARA